MTGLSHLLRDLDELKSDLTPGQGGKTDELLKKITYATWQDADLSYQLAEGDGIEGADTVAVDREIDGDTATITASSPQILFVEFGTGINVNEGSLSDYANTHGYSPAAYSMQNSQWLLPPKSIQFKGRWPIPGTYDNATRSSEWTEGHPAVDALYHAFQRLVSNYYPEAARRIFK